MTSWFKSKMTQSEAISLVLGGRKPTVRTAQFWRENGI